MRLIRPPANPDTFQKLTAGLQSIALTLAVIIGGLWAVYNFTALNQRDRARAELDDLRRKLREQAVLDLDISAFTRRFGKESVYYVDVIIKVENKGNRNAKLNLSHPPPVTVARLNYSNGSSNQPDFDSPGSAFLYTNVGKIASEHVIRAGEIYRYHALVRVKEPGLYLVAFNTDVTAADTVQELGQAGHWAAVTYVTVQ